MATKRGYYREELIRSVDNIDMCLTHLARVVVEYQTAHPEISDKITQVALALIEIQKIITAIHDSF